MEKTFNLDDRLNLDFSRPKKPKKTRAKKKKYGIANNRSRQRLIRIPHDIDQWLRWRASKNADNPQNLIAPEIKHLLSLCKAIDVKSGEYAEPVPSYTN